MAIITPARLKLFAPKCDAKVIAPALRSAAVSWNITTPKRISHWLGQLHHECMGFTRLEENLNYSASRLCAVWPSRFPDEDAAAPFAYDPEALANKCYGGRFGNDEPGDGWKYRGRGFTGLTFKDNYRDFGKLLGEPLEENPDLASDPVIAARIAGAFWWRKGLNDLADKDDVTGITKRIQGGSLGLAERKALVAKAKSIFK